MQTMTDLLKPKVKKEAIVEAMSCVPFLVGTISCSLGSWSPHLKMISEAVMQNGAALEIVKSCKYGRRSFRNGGAHAVVRSS